MQDILADLLGRDVDISVLDLWAFISVIVAEQIRNWRAEALRRLHRLLEAHVSDTAIVNRYVDFVTQQCTVIVIVATRLHSLVRGGRAERALPEGHPLPVRSGALAILRFRARSVRAPEHPGGLPPGGDPGQCHPLRAGLAAALVSPAPQPGEAGVFSTA